MVEPSGTRLEKHDRYLNKIYIIEEFLNSFKVNLDLDILSNWLKYVIWN